MNPAGQPGQMAQGQPNGQQQQKRQHIYQPHEMDNLPIPETDKVKYKQGLIGLWKTLRTAAPGTPDHQDALKKATAFTTTLGNRIRLSQGGGVQGSQRSSTTQAGFDQSTTAPAGSPPASAGGQPGQTPAMAGGPNAQRQQPQHGSRPAGLALNPAILKHVNETVMYAPQNVLDQGPEAVAQWLGGQRDKYTTIMVKNQQMNSILQNNEHRIKMLQQKGAGMTQEEQKSVQELTNRMQQAKTQREQTLRPMIDQIRKEQAAIKEARGLAAGAPSDLPASQPARPGQQPGNANVAQANSSGEQAKSQPAGIAGRMAGANAQAGQQPPQLTQPPQAAPVTTAQSTPTQQIKNEPGVSQSQVMSQPQVPPPVNTAIASAAAAGMPSAGTPTHNAARMPATPIQTSTPTTVHSLSHSAALNLANNHRMSGIANQNSQLQGTPQGQAGTPSSAGVMGSTAQQPGHPHAHPGQQQPQTALPSKLPVPKVLPEKAAQPPQPVSTSIGGVAPGRPTYTGGGGTAGGVMGQPILPKIPQVQMEGEGERVLNRKKLDDLVRQVCGGQAEGQEGNALTPDVEEAVLSMADSFVDSLLHSACSIAKGRGSKVLEIRDIQLVLERTYNIRIPGYATDELRAVRKIQPAVGWLTKISAIQASKVTGNKEF